MATEKADSKNEAAWAKLSNLFGGAVHRGDEAFKLKAVSVPLPSPSLCDASHFWGIPLGMLTQFRGTQGSGKTFMAMLMVKQFQELFPDCEAVWFDAEYTFDTKWAATLGVDLTRLRIVKDNNAANIFTMICGEPGKGKDKEGKPKAGKPGILDLTKQGIINVKLIVVDSIAAMIPPVEEGRSLHDQNMAALARFLPGAMRVLSGKIADCQTGFICINQARDKIGARVPTLTYSGGRAYMHQLALDIQFTPSTGKDSKIMVGEKKVGHKVIASVEKSKAGPDKYRAELWFDFYKGVVKMGEEVAMLGAAYGVVERPSNTVWVYGDVETRGKDNFYAYLEENKGLMEAIIVAVKALKDNGSDRNINLSDDSAIVDSIVNDGDGEPDTDDSDDE